MLTPQYHNTIWTNTMLGAIQYNGMIPWDDIFPADGYPSAHENLYFAKLKNYKFLRCFAMYKSKCAPGIPRKIAYCGKLIFSSICEAPGIKYYLKKEISLAKKYDFENTDYILCQGGGWNQKGKLKKDIYINRKLYDFNGLKVWGISDYHRHLTKLYGDYMKLPSEEKRISNHNYILYVKKDILKNICKEKRE